VLFTLPLFLQRENMHPEEEADYFVRTDENEKMLSLQAAVQWGCHKPEAK